MYKNKEVEKQKRSEWLENHQNYYQDYYKKNSIKYKKKLTPAQRSAKVSREHLGGKYNARQNYNQVVRPKILSLNVDTSCQICGEKKSFFHHIKYSINYWYIGYHLCREHHLQAHKDIKILDNVIIRDYNYLVKRPKYIEL